MKFFFSFLHRILPQLHQGTTTYRLHSKVNGESTGAGGDESLLLSCCCFGWFSNGVQEVATGRWRHPFSTHFELTVWDDTLCFDFSVCMYTDWCSLQALQVLPDEVIINYFDPIGLPVPWHCCTTDLNVIPHKWLIRVKLPVW